MKRFEYTFLFLYKCLFLFFSYRFCLIYFISLNMFDDMKSFFLFDINIWCNLYVLLFFLSWFLFVKVIFHLSISKSIFYFWCSWKYKFVLLIKSEKIWKYLFCSYIIIHSKTEVCDFYYINQFVFCKKRICIGIYY